MKQIAFIINPISGTHSKKGIPELIEQLLDKKSFQAEIVFTKYRGHGTELAKHYVEQNYYAVIAVGGDGTVNEVGKALIHTQTALGIIPCGSGNGLARHMGISMQMKKAIQQINHSEIIWMDYGLMNDIPFFCTCGIGFDAYISSKFATASKRGLLSYIEKMITGYFKYQSEQYHLKGTDIDITTKAFFITFANASQWGNNAYIAPQASVQDGYMNIAIMSSFPMIIAPTLALQLFIKTIDKDIFMNTITTNEITLLREHSGALHYDGEPIEMGKEIHVKIITDGLKMLVEKRF